MRLEVLGVSYTYPGSDRPALSDVSCSLESGRLVVLTGANGSGKSTLAKVMAGLLEPDAGQVNIDGGTLKRGWNGVGYLFQNPDEQLLASSVERELAWGLENLRLPPQEMECRVEEGLERFGLAPVRRRSPGELSDGEKQLVALAALVVMRPAFLVLDEATAFLDPAWETRIFASAHAWSRRMGVLWITTRAEAARQAAEVWRLDGGRIASLRPAAMRGPRTAHETTGAG